MANIVSCMGTPHTVVINNPCAEILDTSSVAEKLYLHVHVVQYYGQSQACDFDQSNRSRLYTL